MISFWIWLWPLTSSNIKYWAKQHTYDWHDRYTINSHIFQLWFPSVNSSWYHQTLLLIHGHLYTHNVNHLNEYRKWCKKYNIYRHFIDSLLDKLFSEIQSLSISMTIICVVFLLSLECSSSPFTSFPVCSVWLFGSVKLPCSPLESSITEVDSIFTFIIHFHLEDQIWRAQAIYSSPLTPVFTSCLYFINLWFAEFYCLIC